ncbi:phosphate signaling complex protein PhoU [Nocardioides panacisoli]|uniref:phosphate signaling complex protein PhoU n=1 Tax=Nocardioides panacisoli TaxID=627624 RepID=UPI001C639ECD|nr:phosphate signaling complex protein PhoU [Nocardioides panacisoli]QYJ02704.1 phosphate signaling complex protein PhoU [Nocardioides panacisoli]
MREAYQTELDGIFLDLAAMCRKVERAVADATTALTDADASVAERVISADVEIDEARDIIEDKAFNLIAQQQPVATDLRIVVAALRMVSELERMGDLSVHVAKIARLRVPQNAVPAPLAGLFGSMSEVAKDMTERVRQVILTQDVEAAIALGKDDEEMDRLRRQSFAELLEGEWEHGVESAVDVALLGRYYERISDHAVSVANRVVFVVTGHYPEAANA